MISASKISVLSAILIADLFFFMFFALQYPEIFQLILEWLPWEDVKEKAIIVMFGLFISVISSAAIIRMVLKSLQKS